MAQRGRKSTASLSIVPSEFGHRPDPPSNLTDAQAEIWRHIAATKPSDWFNHDTYPLLAQYCRHIDSANQLATQVNAIVDLTEKTALPLLDRLLKMRQRESKTIIELASCMRLTQASRMRAETSREAANLTVGKPWESNVS